MQKIELIKQIASKTGLQSREVTKVVECYHESIIGALIENEPVFIRGFGTYRTVTRKSKVARNITAQKTMIVPEHQKPVLKFSKEVLGAVKQSKN